MRSRDARGRAPFRGSPRCAHRVAAPRQGRRGPEAGSRGCGSSRYRMLGTERFLQDRQRPLEKGPRADQIALGLKQAGEVVEARRRFGMLGAERLFAIASARSKSARDLAYAASAPCLYEASRSRRKLALVSAPSGGVVAPLTKSSARASSRRARGQAPGSLNTLLGRPPPSP